MKTLGFSTETGRIVIRKDSIDAVLYSDTGAYPQWCTLLVRTARQRDLMVLGFALSATLTSYVGCWIAKPPSPMTNPDYA